jgi:hypothetical protein
MSSIVTLVRDRDGDLVHPDTLTPGTLLHNPRCDGTGWAVVDGDRIPVRCPVCRPHTRPTPRTRVPDGWRDRR